MNGQGASIRAQLTPDDWALLHMLRASQWGPGATLVLPSGIRLSGEQVAALLPDEGEPGGSLEESED